MRVLIINGNPEGEETSALRACKRIEKAFPDHEFELLDAGSELRALENSFQSAARQIAIAALLIFSFRAGSYFAPTPIHRIIALMKQTVERGELSFEGKAATLLCSAGPLSDGFVRAFIEDNCAELGLNFIDGFSAEEKALRSKEVLSAAHDFFSFVLWSISEGIFKTPRLLFEDFTPVKLPFADLLSVTPEVLPLSHGKSIAIVMDSAPGDSRLPAMVSRLKARLPYITEVLNIRDLRCCSELDSYLRESIGRHDAIVCAFRIEDHSMGFRFRLLDDILYGNGGTPPVFAACGYLISGALSREGQLRCTLEACARERSGCYAGLACDETESMHAIDRLARSLHYALEHSCVPVRGRK